LKSVAEREKTWFAWGWTSLISVEAKSFEEAEKIMYEVCNKIEKKYNDDPNTNVIITFNGIEDMEGDYD
jgi:hypothetical protein